MLRGWTSVDATLAGRPFRLVDTHLEALGESVCVTQAREPVARRGFRRARIPVILVGDFNSHPTGVGDLRPLPTTR